MRAYRRHQIERARDAAAHLYLAQRFAELADRKVRDHHLRKALRIITIHGAPRLRGQAKELIGRLK